MQPAVTGKNKLHTDTFDRRPDAKRHASPHKCRELRQHKTHEATPPSFGILRHARGTVSANRGDAVLCFCRFRVVFLPPSSQLTLTLEQVDRSSSPPTRHCPPISPYKLPFRGCSVDTLASRLSHSNRLRLCLDGSRVQRRVFFLLQLNP